jgi:hypothetical protein
MRKELHSFRDNKIRAHLCEILDPQGSEEDDILLGCDNV